MSSGEEESSSGCVAKHTVSTSVRGSAQVVCDHCPKSQSDDFPSIKWTAVQLKEYLKNQGGKISGRKGDLLDR